MDKQRLIPLIVTTAPVHGRPGLEHEYDLAASDRRRHRDSPLTLKLAITSCLLSLAVFIPVSGWIADRFGARKIFSIAIGVFMLGSIGCARRNRCPIS